MEALSPRPVPGGIGGILKEARLAQGLSLYTLAYDLNLSVQVLEAVEAEAWERVPPGRERPYARQIAERLGVDLSAHPEAFGLLPGAMDPEPPDPRRERMERILMGSLTAGSVLLVLWLVVPGRNLRPGKPRAEAAEDRGAPARWKPLEPTGPYPVVGEVLPEAPVNEEGVLISLRGQDTCEATVGREGDAASAQHRTLRVSEPWTLRMKGPFTVTLDNAGVVILDVAGHRIRHGAAVGEAWTGRFGENGDWIVPEAPPNPGPPTAPESDQEGE